MSANEVFEHKQQIATFVGRDVVDKLEKYDVENRMRAVSNVNVLIKLT